MKMSLKLMTTTAILTGMLALSTASHAEEQGWVGQITSTVESWFTPQNQTPTEEVEAYLDEVTIAVPPMADETLTEIQPAAGETTVTAEEIENLRNATDSTLNTDFDPNSTVTAFTDPVTMTAEELNTIETAAGDAEEITDEAVIVVQETMDDAEEITDESIVVTGNHTMDKANEVEASTQEAMKAAEEKINQSTEEMKKMVDDMNKQAEEAAAETVETADEAVIETTETVEEMTAEGDMPAAANNTEVETEIESQPAGY